MRLQRACVDCPLSSSSWRHPEQVNMCVETESHAKHDSTAGRGVDITDLALVAGASACLSKHGHSRVRTVLWMCWMQLESLLFFDADKHNLRVQYSLTMLIAKPCTGGQLFWWISAESFIESGRFFSSGDRRSYSWKTLLRPRTLEVTLM